MGFNQSNAMQLTGPVKGMVIKEDANGNIGIFNGAVEVGYFKPNSVGIGLPSILASYSAVGKAALVANAINFTPPATAGTYRLFVQVNVHTAAAVDMNVTLTYKDAGGNAQSYVLPLNISGAVTVYISTNNVTGVFFGELIFQINNSQTAITVSTTGTTMTLYDLAVVLEQLV